MRRVLAATQRVLTAKRKADATEAARELTTSPAGLALLGEVAKTAGVPLRLNRDGRIAARAILLPRTSGVRLTGLVPGRYSLSIGTGRLLWERELYARDVLSSVALGGWDLRAAAQTGEYASEATVVESVSDGALAIKVFPGRESGALLLVYNPPA